MPSFARDMHEYEMPTTMMAILYNSSQTFGENSMPVFSPYHASKPLGNQFGRLTGLGFSHQVMPTFTPSTVAIMRQQMDESNPEMVNMLT